MGKHQRELTQIQDDHKVELNRMQKALDVVSDQASEACKPHRDGEGGGTGSEDLHTQVHCNIVKVSG